MGASDESFLPQIVGIFYATFDPKLGPTVLHQVPENLITPHVTTDTANTSRSRSRSTSASRSRSTSTHSRGSKLRYSSPSPTPSSSSSATHLSTILDFAPISDYIIPKKSLHGRLVTILTTGNVEDEEENEGEKEEYRVMGFPSVLKGEGGRYVRNEYMWNLCFVFAAGSSLEAFEPVVRKCARILRSAELDSAYLSAPSPKHTPLPAVLEQLFEDLNSYSETSIPLDGFNSLELKLFPFFPNPPECEDWHVPIPLVDLNSLKDDNWDITAARVAEHIDGVNHVRKIAELADADPALTRETLRHMLFYQVVMMVDIFQYSNMYTLKPSITRLSSDPSIISECGPYVTLPSHTPLSWPNLLSLYTKLLPSITVHSFIESQNLPTLGIDPRRFVSFGIIKGFLRRVHRWPVLVERGSSPLIEVQEGKGRRVEFDKHTGVNGGGARAGSGILSLKTNGGGESTFTKSGESGSGYTRFGGPGDSAFTLRTSSSHASLGLHLGVSPGSNQTRTPPSVSAKSPQRKQVTTAFTNIHSHPPQPRSSTGDPSHSSKRTGTARSGGQVGWRIKEEEQRVKEEELIRFLDGNHHCDEIQVKFGMGWRELEKVLGVEKVEFGMGRKGVALICR